MEDYRTQAQRHNRRVGTLAVLLVTCAFAPPSARGDYVESYQEWQATSAYMGEQNDLSGAPFNVPAEVADGQKIRIIAESVCQCDRLGAHPRAPARLWRKMT